MAGANTGSAGLQKESRRVISMTGANTGTAGGQQDPKPVTPPTDK